MGPDYRLVWDKIKRTWVVRKVDKVSPNDTTFQDWLDGETSYATPADDRSPVPADIQQKTKDVEDPLAVYVEKYGLQIVTDPETGKSELKGFEIDPKTGKRKTVTVKYYIYLDSKNQIQLSSDYDAIKSKAIADLKASGQLNALFEDLYKKKLISKATYNSKNLAAADFNAALLGSIESYSRSVITNREFGDTKEAPNFLSYLQKLAAGGDGVSEADLPRREFQDISKEQLNSFIDKIYLETIGRKPTDDQRKAKLKELDSIVKAGILTTKKVTGGEVQYRTTGGFNEEQQGLMLQEKLKTENPLEYQRRQAFSFMDQLSNILGGGK